MSEWLDPEGEALRADVAAIIRRGTDVVFAPDALEALAMRLFAWQRRRSLPIDRIARAYLGARPAGSLAELPGVPTDAFQDRADRHVRAPVRDPRVPYERGTTGERRGVHAFADTSLYTAAALASAQRHLLPRTAYRLVLLAEPEPIAPTSSLTFMLARLADQWPQTPGDDPWMLKDASLDLARIRHTLSASTRDGTPLAMLGASFAFVHWLDALAPDERVRAARRAAWSCQRAATRGVRERSHPNSSSRGSPRGSGSADTRSFRNTE